MVEWQQLLIADMRERRYQGGERPGVPPHRERFARETHLVHRLLDLLLDAFGRQSSELGRALDDRVPGIALDVEAEARGESDRAQRTESVLPHPVTRIADRANELAVEIFLPAIRVADLILARR